MRRRSMAAFMEASMANGAPALTAPVKPARTSCLQVDDGPHRLHGHGLLEPEGSGDAPRLW